MLETLDAVDSFAVATIDEALSLRSAGITKDILILGIVDPTRIQECITHNLTVTVASVESAQLLDSSISSTLKVHIALDTGMGRLGLPTTNINDTTRSVHTINKLKNIEVEGLFTHLSVSDSTLPEDIIFTKKQIKTLVTIENTLKEEGLSFKKIHYCNSAGSLFYYDPTHPFIRPGIIIYGLSPNPAIDLPIDLENVVTIHAKIIQLKKMAPGTPIGYGRSFIAKKEMIVAVASIGYADGLDRRLSNRGFIHVNNSLAPIVGKVCMDMLMIDVTSIKGVAVGNEITLCGKDLDILTNPTNTASIDTISYELISILSPRLPRIYYTFTNSSVALSQVHN